LDSLSEVDVCLNFDNIDFCSSSEDDYSMSSSVASESKGEAPVLYSIVLSAFFNDLYNVYLYSFYSFLWNEELSLLRVRYDPNMFDVLVRINPACTD
jgi:hypothetical protein